MAPDERSFAGFEHLLDDLNPAQRQAVVSTASPLCILAGAGSGKTRVLTRRIAYRLASGTADASHVLSLTFTRKAAGELRQRLFRLGIRDSVAAGTFHSLAYAQLRLRWADAGQREPALLDRKARLLAPLISSRSRPGSERSRLQPADVASEIEWAKARMLAPDAYAEAASAAGRTPPLPFEAMAALYQRYEDEKRRRGLVDFDDLLLLCAQALEDDAAFAAAQRWRFRHLFVDEFQDVNPVQHRLLDGWLGDRQDLCVVGDPNQAIYSWNGADPTFLTRFAQRRPGAEIVRLDDNYRSSPQVLAVANTVLAAGRSRHDIDLRANRPDGPIPTVRSYDSDTTEARAVASRVRRAHAPGTAWSRIAVLARTNAQAVLFEEAFRAAGIPFRVRGGGAFLQLPEIRDALAGLAAGATVPFASVLNDLSQLADATPVPDRKLNLEALVRLGHEYAGLDSRASVAGFTAWLAATIKPEDASPDSDVVEICTFHKAKGLEWPVVFVTGLERGLVPIGHADTPEAEAEERRLLYVALTRAEVELHCTWAERRTFGTRTVPRSPSPWLATIEDSIAALADGVTAGSATWRERIAAQRATLAKTPKRRTGPAKVGDNADPLILTALKEWRSREARASKVPAYVIFHDTTLAAVAEAQPRTERELLALPGLGPVKATRYGEALLAVVKSTRRSA